MPRVPVRDVDDCPPESREALEQLTKRMGGKTLNIFGGMANSPAVINLYTSVEGTLGEYSSFDAGTRKAIHLTVANVNGCHYCQAAYTGGAKAAGFSEEQTLQIRSGHLDGDERFTALLGFAREIAGEKGHVSDATWNATLQAGWSEPELLDAFGEVIRTTLTNWFNHLVGTERDLPAAPPLD